MSRISANLAKLMNDYTSFTFGTARRYNVSAYQLEKSISQGVLTKLSIGTYVVSGYLEDEMSIISQRFSRGVFSQDKNKISIYSVERALLDAWNSPNTQLYVKNDAAKRYMQRKDRNYQELLTLERELYPKSTLSEVLEVIAQ